MIIGFENGYLNFFDWSGVKITETQHKFLLKTIEHFTEINTFLEYCKRINVICNAVEEDLSFDRLWKEYGVKRDRERCVKIFSRIKKSDIVSLFANMKAYKRYLKVNTDESRKVSERGLFERMGQIISHLKINQCTTV